MRLSGSPADVAGALESSLRVGRPSDGQPGWVAGVATKADAAVAARVSNGDPATDTRPRERRNERRYKRRYERQRQRSNKGMELTSALPRFARWHGRRSQLMPGVRRTIPDRSAHGG